MTERRKRLSDNTFLFIATIIIVIVAFAINIVLINWVNEDNQSTPTNGVNVETSTTFELLS